MLNNIAGVLAPTTPLVTNSYESIMTYDVGSGGSTSITFSSIPSTYKHLQIRGIARSTRAISFDGLYAYFNGDTTLANYYQHGITGDGATASAFSGSSNYTAVGIAPGTSSTANAFNVSVTDILDYQNTSKYKTTRSLAGTDLNGSGQVRFLSGLWMNSVSAITSITLTTNGGGNFAQYSSFALYGIKG